MGVTPTTNVHGTTIREGGTIEAHDQEYTVTRIDANGDRVELTAGGETRQIVREGDEWYLATTDIDARHAGRATRVVELAGTIADPTGTATITAAEVAVKRAQETLDVDLPRDVERVAIEELADRLHERDREHTTPGGRA